MSDGANILPGEQPITVQTDAGNIIVDPALFHQGAAAAVLDSLSCPPPEQTRPASTLPGPTQLANDAYKSILQALINQGAPCWLAFLIAQVFGALVFGFSALVGAVLWSFEVIGIRILPIGLKMIDTFRHDIDPAVAQFSVLVLNEIMGTDFGPQDLPTGDSIADHNARASIIGAKYINTITAEIAPGTDLESLKGIDGVARFTGLIVNFGLATALLGLAGEIGSVGLLKDFRLIGEQVSSGLGLSKQMRIAIKPLLKTLVATPFQWFLNERYHPQRFSLNEVINSFQQTLMDHDTIVKDLELQGWSPDRAEQLIKLHQKRFTADEVETLRRWGHWADDTADKYVQSLGWPQELVQTVLVLPELKRIDARMVKLVDALEQNVVDGHMTLDDFLAFIKTLPFTQDEQAVIQATVTAKQKSPHKSLTLAEIQAAFDQGLVTLDDVDTWLVDHGYTGDDQQILAALTLLKFARTTEAVTAAKFAYEQKVSKAKAKGLPIPPPPGILAGLV